ncbi:MAG: ATP synthase F1 subunit delta [Oscillospiraceae bacterium]
MTQTAQTYGRALYELARDEGLGGELLEQLHMCVGAFKNNPQYAELLSLPSIPKKERCQVLDECLSGRVHKYLLSFMKILVENGTIRELPNCEEAYRALYYEDNGIMPVAAVTAVPLKKELRERLRAKLAAVTGKKIELHERIDASVIGGIRLEMDGKSLDGTVRTRLDEISKKLSGTVL